MIFNILKLPFLLIYQTCRFGSNIGAGRFGLAVTWSLWKNIRSSSFTESFSRLSQNHFSVFIGLWKKLFSFVWNLNLTVMSWKFSVFEYWLCLYSNVGLSTDRVHYQCFESRNILYTILFIGKSSWDITSLIQTEPTQLVWKSNESAFEKVIKEVKQHSQQQKLEFSSRIGNYRFPAVITVYRRTNLPK